MPSHGIHLRKYKTPTTPDYVIQDLDLTWTGVADEAATVQVKVSDLVAEKLETPFYAAIEVLGEGEWVKPRNDLFVFHELDRDEKDPARVRTFVGVLYVADRASVTYLTEGGADGSTTWKNASAGAVVADILTRKAGHGITRTFTATVDSNGTPWPAADKTDQTFAQLSSVASVISALAKGAYCQWWAQGTELKLELVNSGVDRTSIPIGPGASSITPRESTTETASVFYVISDQPGVPMQTVTRPELGAGRREAIVTVAGATTVDVALRMAQPIIDRAAQRRLEYTVIYDAENLPAKPLIDFQLGDKFAILGTTHRLVGIQISKTSGRITVRLTFGERFLTLAAKIAARTAQISFGTLNLTGGSGTPVAPGVVLPAAEPEAPTALAVASNVGAVDEAGRPYAEVRLTWDAVRFTVTGADTRVSEYEVWVQTEGRSAYPIGRVAGPEFTGQWDATPRTVTVRAFNGQWSDFSDPVEVTPAQPEQITTAPSLPQLLLGAGLIVASWDGTLASGEDMPASFDRLFAVYADDAAGPWTRFGAATNAPGQVASFRGDVGQPVFVRFAWVDTSGRTSDFSETATAVVVGVTPGDLDSIEDFYADEAVIAALRVNTLGAGVIEVDMLAPNVGERIDITANEGLTILTGRVQDIEDGVATYYRFGPDGAIIGRPEDPTQLELRNDAAVFTVNGVEATSWGPEGMVVPNLRAPVAVLGNHVFEAPEGSTDRTLIRWAGVDEGG